MDGLHQTAIMLAKAELDYVKAASRLAAFAAARAAAKAARNAAIVAAISENPERTNVEIAAHFGVSEGTIRIVRSRHAAATT